MFSENRSPRSIWRTAAIPGVACALFLVIVWFSYREWRQYDRANKEAAQTREIVDSVDGLLSDLIDAQSGQRGYLLTGENRYLEPYNRAVQAIPNDLSAIGGSLAARPGQAPIVERLDDLTGRKLSELRQTIEMRRTAGVPPALADSLLEQGKRTMDEIRFLCAQIQRAEISSHSQASTEGEAAAGTALLAAIVGALVLLFLFAFGLQPFASPEPQAWQRPWPLRYGAAVLAVIVVALLREALTPLVGRTHIPFSLFFCAVAFAAWFGGFRPAVLSIALSLAAGDYFFAAPTRTLLLTSRDDQVAMLMIIVVGFGMGLLSRSQRGAVDRALRAEIAERIERERFATTLASIGDAVIATDSQGHVTFANQIALQLTGWRGADAIGKPLEEVFHIVNEDTRAAVESPVVRVLREGAIVGLANHTVLLAKDGSEVPIDDSAAPIRDAEGLTRGTVLVFRDVTERRRAEAATHLLASIVESSEDAIVTEDLNGVITSWNQGGERIFGYRAQEAIGRPASILAPPEDSAEPPEIPDRVRRGEHVKPFETVRRTKAGGLVHVSQSMSAVLDASGRVHGISTISRDITAWIEAQRQIAEHRERLRVTLGSIGDAVVATDTDGRVTYLNPVAERLTGWSARNAAGQPLEDVFRIISEESRQTMESPAARVLRDGEVVGLANHTLLISRDGREIAIDDSAAPIRNTRGGMIGMVLVFRDVSAKRAGEKLAAEQTAELRRRAHLMEDVPCFVRDLDDRIVYWNPGATGLYAFTPADAAGHKSHSLLNTVFPAPLEEIREAVFATGKWDGELVHTRRDGSRVTVASHWALHRDENGEPISILEVNTDISERLELLAKERALVSEKALRQKEAELARVARALSVGELASSIAHEVNQPLAGVVTNAEAAIRWLTLPNIEEAKQSLALIARDANRASGVIRGIREFLRKETPEAAPFDVNGVIEEAVALMGFELANRRIELRTDFAKDLPRVSGNHIQLQQVVLNLLMNGAESMATTGGPKRLAVSTRPSAEGVLVAVRDSGAGISVPDMSRMFEAFFTTKPSGIGMGLSISRSILEAHGGRIWAEANDGPGITVNFSLPAESQGAKVSRAQAS